MPQMSLLFETAEYMLIPEPKRTWVMKVIREALHVKSVVKEVPGPIEREFAFRVYRGGALVVLRGFGATPAIAATALGLPADPTIEWKTAEEATAEGWFESVDPMEV